MERITLDSKHLVKLYLGGESCLALSKLFAVSRTVIDRIITESGTALRTQSEAETLKWSRMSSDRRAHQVAAAHAAVRGRKVPLEVKIQQAQARQQASRASDLEREVAAALRSRGLETIPQFAIGPYNCDLAAFPVAIEVFGGNWHWHGGHIRRAPERIRYLLNAGWHVLMVRINRKVEPFTEATANYIVSWVKRVSSDPSAPRQYRVIRRAGEMIASGSINDDKVSIEPTFTNRRDPATGRYQTVPR